MNKIRIFPLLLIVPLLGIVFFFQIPNSYGQQELTSPFSSNRPLIDGVIDLGEWDDAFITTFERIWDDESHQFSLYLKNDDKFLYIAVMIKGEDVHFADMLTVEFDNDNDEVEEYGEDRLVVSPFLYFFTKDGFFSGSNISHDIDNGGTSEITARVTHSDPTSADTGAPGDYTFEIRHPLNSGDSGHDIGLEPPETVGFRIIFRDSLCPPREYCSDFGFGFFPEEGFAKLTVSEGSVINPPPQILFVPKDFSTIREAILSANPGDTIAVSGETYTEELTIDIPLTLEGKGYPRLVGGGNPVALNHVNIFVSSDDVAINGFKLQSEGADLVDLISLFSSNNVSIENNKFHEGSRSMRANLSHNVSILDNMITDSLFEGITLSYVSDSMVIDNLVINGHAGIILHETENSIVDGNEVSENCHSGIILRYNSFNNTIIENTISNNNAGIVISNGSSYNFLHHNNIIENKQQLVSYGDANFWDDGSGEGNFWSDYEGEDLNKDGIGDTLLPYQGIEYYPFMKNVH